MTTFRNSVRSYSAAKHRMEKAQQKNLRRVEKERLIRQEIDNAAHAIQQHQQEIEELISIHKEDVDSIGWEDIRREPCPAEPILEKNLAEFKPGFWDKLFGYKRRLKRLETNISIARKKDEIKHTAALADYREHCEEWQTLQMISEGVLNKDPEAYEMAIAYFKLFNEIDTWQYMLFKSINANNVTLDLEVNKTDVIPDYVLSQTSTGKLSKKNMPVTKHNKIYQEHICSVVLRVARDLFSVVPVKAAVVNVAGERLNTATGKLEKQTLLSVLFYPEILNGLNFEALDPSDAMQNFMHKMKFTNSGGFSAVEKINVETVRERR